MQVVIHAGAHFTDEDRLVTTLEADAGSLAEHGVCVPEPRLYRKLMRDLFQAAVDSRLAPGTRDIVLDALDVEHTAHRLILSNHSFFGTPKMAVGRGLFYPGSELRLATLQEIFDQDELTLALALRNPATYLPALFARTPHDSMEAFLNEFDPWEFRWSETIARLHAAFPDMPILLWCNEDTPLVWARVLRAVTGLTDRDPVPGEFDLLEGIMTDTGFHRLRSYLSTHDDLTEPQRQRVKLAFLDKFVQIEEIEEELDLPGWDDDIVDELSEAYDQDVEALSQMPGITMISP
ncbi:MAG: hypothetical protein AAGA28_16295 [Pseudomonadota bacterium]